MRGSTTLSRKPHKQIDYEAMIEEDTKGWWLIFSYFRWYPDRLYDLMESENADFALQLPQRVNMRAMVRYARSFVTGSRGAAKTYTTVSTKAHGGVVWPGTKVRYVAPSEKQAAPIASAAWKQIKRNYPLMGTFFNDRSDSNEHFSIETKNGSTFSTYINRGDNVTEIVAEEVGQEDKYPFDHETFRQVSLPTVRLQHMVNKLPDPTHVDFIETYITSASRQQNEAYQIRCDILKTMREGGSAFAIDIPYEVVVLAFMKPFEYYEKLRQQLTPEEFLRECKSRYTGTSENPIVSDEKLQEAKTIKVAETKHNGDKDAIYIISYDVSYTETKRNAMCATAVVRCDKNEDPMKADKYKKSLVYICDNPPPKSNIIQAKQVKALWYKYCMEGGNATYITIDCNQYGRSVLEALHGDLGDGLPPLCCVDHRMRELEHSNALPVIYPISATAGAHSEKHDADSEMIRYAEIEFENGNVNILTTNVREGVDAYKLAHRIKDDRNDYIIQIPYKKCKEFCEQISNLKKVPSGAAVSEKQMSPSINRDMWSAFKYALRYASILERKELYAAVQRGNGWSAMMQQHAGARPKTSQLRSRVPGRVGGNGRALQ